MDTNKIIDSFTVDFNDQERATKLTQYLKENGVVVVKNVFTNDECDTFMNHMVSGMQKISPELSTETYNKLKSTWKDRDIMPQVRKGLHQQGYSFLGWPVRGSSQVSQIFREAYSGVRGYEINETVTSLDAINVRPPIPPFEKPENDWAHVDQTEMENIFECIQGQVVLTNTTAGFRCSPKSHLIHSEMLNHFGATGKRGNFFKLKNHEYQDVQNMVKRVGGTWQIPIIVPRGCMILWLSSTIHSAKLQDPDFTLDPNEKWKHWRGVVYVCQRPKAEVSAEHIKGLQYAFENNITTNHWGNKLFKKTFGATPDKFNSKIGRYMKNPKEIYKCFDGKPELSQTERSLIGL